MSLMSGTERLAPSTIRGHHVTLRLFCDYVLDGRYGWVDQCEERFGKIPSQVCHDFNTAAHLVDYEGRPQRRPFSYDELQRLFDYLDARVEKIARSGRKGALAALRDAQMVKTAYAFGLRRRELCYLDIADLRPTRRCLRGAPTAQSMSATPNHFGAAHPGDARCWQSRSSTGLSTGCGSGSNRPARY